MFTLPELQILMPVIDAGVKAAGIQIFQSNGGVYMQSALAKLQQMAEAAQAEAAETTEKSNGDH